MSLTPYLTQLLDDLRGRHGIFPEKPNIRAFAPDPDFPEEMEGSMIYLYGPQYAMSDLFEISTEAFPPAEMLSPEQAETLVQAILELWASVNLFADLPDGLPLSLAYPQLVRLWGSEPVSVVREGMVHLEFCEYETENCPWPEAYCRCKHFES